MAWKKKGGHNAAPWGAWETQDCFYCRQWRGEIKPTDAFVMWVLPSLLTDGTVYLHPECAIVWGSHLIKDGMLASEPPHVAGGVMGRIENVDTDYDDRPGWPNQQLIQHEDSQL